MKLGRLTEAMLVAAIRRGTSEWGRALLAELSALPAGRQRLWWLAGGVRLMMWEALVVRNLAYGALALAVLALPLFFRFGVVAFFVAAVIVGVAVGAMIRPLRSRPSEPDAAVTWATPVRAGICAAVTAVVVLAIIVVTRYPHAAEGKGGPLFTAILAALLATYITATFRITARGSSARSTAVRYGTVAGLVGGILYAAGTPAGGTYQVNPTWLDVTYAIGVILTIVVPLLLAGGLSARTTGRLEQGILAGAWTGAVAALTNLIAGMTTILILPGLVPPDPDVLANAHTPQEILAGNIGEDLVGYVTALLILPVLGTILGMLSASIATISRRARVAR